MRGSAKLKLEDYRGAIADLSKAIEINPNYIGAYYGRGGAKYFLGDKNGACLDWSKAGELGYGEAYDLIKQYCK
jgi:tetratricopeptide (TPR) repeat protein